MLGWAVRGALIVALIAAGCASGAKDGVQRDDTDVAVDTDLAARDTDAPRDTDPASETGAPLPLDTDTGPNPFADRVVSFTPGAFAGYGQDQLPQIVLGAPNGRGPTGGSLDVLSLGEHGEIVLVFDDIELVDGAGPDLLVFENAFRGWVETGEVSVSEDGSTWSTWPCDATNAAGGFPGCAGVHAVLASRANGVDPLDPAQAGGDAFDLADVGLTRARYVRIVDSGQNALGGLGYAGTTGGFDLDALAVVNGEAVTP